MEEVFSMWSVPRCYELGTKSERESTKRGIAIVGAVTRKCLVTD
jgi:hypothetical protein